MKKLIAISVMLALVAGAAFAQVSGTVEARLFIVDSTFNNNNEVKKDNNGKDTKDKVDPNEGVTHGDIGAAYIQLSGTNEEGTLGGLFRLRNTDIVRGDAWFHRVFVWWRPIQQMRIFLGIDNDGMFDTASIAGWAFHSGDNDYMFNHHWDFWREIFPGNWDGFGLAFSFYPVQGLNINLVIPTGALGWPQSTASQVRAKPTLRDMYPWGLRLQMSYAIPDIGTINFVYNLGDKDTEAGSNFAYADNLTRNNNGELVGGSHFGRIGLSFQLTAINSMNLLVGGSVVIPDKKHETIGLRAHAGLALTYAGTGWGIKFRAGYRYQERKEKDKDTERKVRPDTQFFNFNVMPIVDVGGGQLMIDFGVSIEPNANKTNAIIIEEEKDKTKKSYTNTFGWYLTPVFRLPIPGGKFSAGLQIYQNIKMGGNIELAGDKKYYYNEDDKTFSKHMTYNKIHLRIPILLSFGF